MPLAIGFIGVSQAQDIHKCIDNGIVAYQNAPCTARQVDAGLLPLPGYADPAERDGAMAPRAIDAPLAGPVEAPFPPQALPDTPDGQDAFPLRTSIAVGMAGRQTYVTAITS